jgi:predicted acylesterase/phospholipase RssA
MLARAQAVLRTGAHTDVESVRAADDLVRLVHHDRRQDGLVAAVGRRRREALATRDVQVNEATRRSVDLRRGESCGGLGFDCRRVRSLRGRWRPPYTPPQKVRAAWRRERKEVCRRYRCRVHVVASDIPRGALLILPDDAPVYGIDPERLEVALAVRMSMSIPYFFNPIMVTNTLGQRCYIVDGGLLSNFPIELFDTPPPAVPEWPTFGFALVSEPADPKADVRIESPIIGPLTLFAALFHTAVVAHDAHAMAVLNVAARTIRIDDLGIPPARFDLTQTQKAALYESGQAAARDFLATWDFEPYKARFRTGAPEVRRQPGLALPAISPSPRV